MEKKALTLFIILALFASSLVAISSNPVLADSTSTITVTNITGATFYFTYAQLQAMPQTVESADLFCYGSLVTSGDWGGVALGYLLEQANVTSDVMSVQLSASDGYRVSVPISLADQPQIIIAYEKDNEPLPEGLRLVIPGQNGDSWIAMITSITMSATEATGPPPGPMDSAPSPSPTGAQPTATPTSTPNPQQPTQAPEARNTATATPTPTQPPDQQQVQPAGFTLPDTYVVLLALTISLVLGTTAYLAIRHTRNNSKVNTQHS